MQLRFTAAFGHHVPGDEIEVPDGAEYDHSYLEPVASETTSNGPVEENA